MGGKATSDRLFSLEYDALAVTMKLWTVEHTMLVYDAYHAHRKGIFTTWGHPIIHKITWFTHLRFFLTGVPDLTNPHIEHIYSYIQQAIRDNKVAAMDDDEIIPWDGQFDAMQISQNIINLN